MVTSNYVRGRAREYQTQEAMRADGYETVRAASSNGCVDVCGFRISDGHIRLIQVKSGTGRCTKMERTTLEALATSLRGKATVEIWTYQFRQTVQIETL